MKRFITLSIVYIICFLKLFAGTDIVYMNVGDTRTLTFNAPPYIVGTQWTISDMDAVEFVSTPGSTATSANIRALSPRTAANRCIVHCTYYYRELDPTTGRYEYQRTGYQDWEIIITGNGGSGNGVTVSMHYNDCSLSEGEFLNLNAYTSDNNYSGNYNWSSSNPEVLSIMTERGPYVSTKAIGQGTSYLRVTLDNGNYDEIKVSVSAKQNQLVFSLTSDGEGYAVSAKDQFISGNVTIPSYYNNKPVKEIKEDGFKLSRIKTVSIPETIEKIGKSAFSLCGQLYQLNIPHSVNIIEEKAFYSCLELTSIDLPENLVTLGEMAFCYCEKLKYAVLSSNITTLEFGTFKGCKSLVSINIPNSIKVIKASAFENCENLSTVYLPFSIEEIEYNTFAYDSNIKHIFYDTSTPVEKESSEIFDYRIYPNATLHVPGESLEIFKKTFPWNSFKNIEEIPMDYYLDYKFRSSLDGYLVKAKSNNTTARIEIPATYAGKPVIGIQASGFSGCSRLKEVVIPNTVKNIYTSAFYNCSNLESVYIPESVELFGGTVFYNCPNIKAVYYNTDSPVSATPQFFFDERCYSNASLYIPIGCSEAFLSINPWKNFKNIVEVDENGDPVVEDNFLFVLNEDKESYSVKSNCALSGDITIPSFHNGKPVTTIATAGFQYQDGIQKLIIPNTIRYIEDFAFSYCTSITSITIPNSVEAIGYAAFYKCSGLTTLTLPNSVTSISDQAFRECTGLTAVTFPNSLESIGNAAFYKCSGLTTVTIPNSVTSISDQAFRECTGLTAVTFPSSIESIGYAAFYKCSGLTMVTFPNSVTLISDQTFGECTGLTAVTFTNSVESIGYAAFYKCTSLTVLTIPESVTSIGDFAFGGCNGLTSVYYGAESPIACNSNTFDSSTYESAILYVRETIVEKCQKFDPWKNFQNIRPYNFYSGLEEVLIDLDKTYKIYNLNGILLGNSIDDLTPDIYIVRQGSTVKKIAVK